jgi:hypothetical protein
MDELADKGVSRRSALKRIGAGAAVAWTAPVLMSVRTPAFAQTPTCTPGACPECQFGLQCGQNCACVGIPVECFCSDIGTCYFDAPVCETDADCTDITGPGSRCAPCVFDPGCMKTSCWGRCGDQHRIPSGSRIRVVRPSR